MKRLDWIILKLSFNISKISFIVLISSSFNGVLALRIFSSSSLTRAVPQRTMSAAIFSIAYRSAIREMLCPKHLRSVQRKTGTVRTPGHIWLRGCRWHRDNGDLSWCLLSDVVARILMLVTSFGCWCYLISHQHVFNIRHQHRFDLIDVDKTNLVDCTFQYIL